MNSNEEEARTKRSFTWDEVRQHKDRGNRWLVIDNDVYDITQWQHKHPGGAKILGHYAGEDASVTHFYFCGFLSFLPPAFAEVMFLHVCVCPQGAPPGGLVLGRCLLRGGRVWSRRGLLQRWCLLGGCLLWGVPALGGACSGGWGGVDTPIRPVRATAACGTHPTGMHSC